jgi:SPOR domain
MNEDHMNVPGSRATDDINLEEFERRLRAAGAQQANVEDPLQELARLVESSYAGSSNSETSARPVSEPDKRGAESARWTETESLRPAIDATDDLVPAASEADRSARQDYDFDASRSHDPQAGAETAEPRPRRWKLAVSALALAGLAMIGAVFALKGRVPGLPKDPPFIAAAQGPTKVQPPSDQTVTAASDPGVPVLKDSGKPASVKILNTEEQPVDLTAKASAESAPAVPPNPPAAADQPKPQGGAADATPVAATIDTPVVPPAPALPPAMTSEFPNPKPVRTVSLRPDGTPIAAINPPAQSGFDAAPAETPTKRSAAPASPPASPPAPAPKSVSDAAAVAEPSTPKLELPTKLSPKSSARVAVAKTDTTAPDANAQTPGEPAQPGAPAKAGEKATKKPKPEKSVAEATAAATATQAPAVDATPATASDGWAVQLAAPRSEAEAKSEAARLTGKYGAELNGSPIGVHKAVVNGETIYRLRVVGLTKADAAALCARLKGEGGECFIAK